jgi:hypothetical protein
VIEHVEGAAPIGTCCFETAPARAGDAPDREIIDNFGSESAGFAAVSSPSTVASTGTCSCSAFPTRFRWGPGIRDTYQLVSSAVSNASELRLRRVVERLPKPEPILGGDEVAFQAEPLPGRAAAADGEAQCNENPYGALNCGIIETSRLSEHESSTRLELVGCVGRQSPEPRIAYDSGPL